MQDLCLVVNASIVHIHKQIVHTYLLPPPYLCRRPKCCNCCILPQMVIWVMVLTQLGQSITIQPKSYTCYTHHPCLGYLSIFTYVCISICLHAPLFIYLAVLYTLRRKENPFKDFGKPRKRTFFSLFIS